MTTPGDKPRRRSARREQGPPAPVEQSVQGPLNEARPNDARPSAARANDALPSAARTNGAPSNQAPSREARSDEAPKTPRPDGAPPAKKRSRHRERDRLAAAAALAGGNPSADSDAGAGGVDSAPAEPTSPERSSAVAAGDRRPAEERATGRRHPDAPSRRNPTPEAPRGPRDRRAELAERALRNLVSTRSTQVSWEAALRARDLAAPGPADLAEAAAELVIVQRHYTPAEPLQSARRSPAEPPRGRSTNKRGN